MATSGFADPTLGATHEQTAFAGWWSRVGATLVDTLILLVPYAIIFAALGSDGAAISYLAWIVAAALYAPLLMAREGARNGQTLGKQVVGIRVVHERGEPMTFGKGILRDFVGKTLLGLTVIYTLVDVLFPLFDGRKQALHDKIGSTTVHPA